MPSSPATATATATATPLSATQTSQNVTSATSPAVTTSPSPYQTPTSQAQPSPPTTPADVQQRRTTTTFKSAYRRLKRYANRTNVLCGVLIALAALAYAIWTGSFGHKLTKWTARNDFHQSCRADEAAGYTYEQCKSTLEQGPVPPPRIKRDMPQPASTAQALLARYWSFWSWYTTIVSEDSWVELLLGFATLILAMWVYDPHYARIYKYHKATLLVCIEGTMLLFPTLVHRDVEARPATSFELVSWASALTMAILMAQCFGRERQLGNALAYVVLPLLFIYGSVSAVLNTL